MREKRSNYADYDMTMIQIDEITTAICARVAYEVELLQIILVKE